MFQLTIYPPGLLIINQAAIFYRDTRSYTL